MRFNSEDALSDLQSGITQPFDRFNTYRTTYLQSIIWKTIDTFLFYSFFI